MKLRELSAKPQLQKCVLDDPATLEEYGEPIEFYMMDRQPLSVFMTLAVMVTTDQAEVIRLVKDLILDEDGKPIISEDETLPGPMMVRVMTFVVERLGKL